MPEAHLRRWQEALDRDWSVEVPMAVAGTIVLVARVTVHGGLSASANVLDAHAKRLRGRAA